MKTTKAEYTLVIAICILFVYLIVFISSRTSPFSCEAPTWICSEEDLLKEKTK